MSAIEVLPLPLGSTPTHSSVEIDRTAPNKGGELTHSRYSFDSIQALRAVAALLVVTMHATADWSHLVDGTESGKYVWFPGNSGVDIFFIISGLVMALSVYGRTSGEPPQRSHAARDFMLRRVIRIVPLYWLFLTMRVVKAFVQQKHMAFTHASFVHMSASYILQSYLFIPSYNSLHQPLPPLPVGWTLSFEMFFYLLLAVALRGRLRADKFLTPIMIVLSVVGLFYGDSWPAVANLLRSSLLLEFLAGLLLGLWIVRGHQIAHRPALICGAIALLGLLFAPFDVSYAPYRGLWWGTMAFGVVLGSLALEKNLAGRWPRPLVFLGNISYSIYLSHYIFFDVVRGGLARLHLTQAGSGSGLANEVVYTLLLLLVAMIGGSLCYLLVERPMTNLFRNLLSTPKRNEAPVLVALPAVS